MKMAHAPPGHHSVIGRPSVNGLAYAEYVIYRGEQVKPLCGYTHVSSLLFRCMEVGIRNLGILPVTLYRLKRDPDQPGFGV